MSKQKRQSKKQSLKAQEDAKRYFRLKKALLEVEKLEESYDEPKDSTDTPVA